MPKIDVTPELVGRLINQVAPLVEFTTRWSLDLQTLKYRVLPKNRGYEEIVLARFAGVGLPVEIDKPRSPGELLIEYMLENNILGAYEPSTQEILVVRENVDESNLDGLRLILAHELVHRGQHRYHPELFDQVDEAIRVGYQMIENASLVETAGALQVQLLANVQPVMTLMESHATYITEIIRRLYLPNGVLESHFSLAQVLFRLLGAKKLGQYSGGVETVAKAAQTGSIDDLFRSFVD